ncbi:MAG TPA: hypothetical protein VHO26_06005 [Propionibacteriaceae bacterium]|nr:hypothetical protein [Propionibacteriaceae bacterium]
MRANEVLTVLETLTDADVPAWVVGGWGVEALAQRVTREHRDLDLAIRDDDLARALAALGGLGFAVETDWLPTRVGLAGGPGGWVDLHPLAFDAEGTGVLAGLDGADFVYPSDQFTQGVIGGRVVQCISAALQRRFHEGYEPRPQDLHDLAVLDDLG